MFKFSLPGAYLANNSGLEQKPPVATTVYGAKMLYVSPFVLDTVTPVTFLPSITKSTPFVPVRIVTPNSLAVFSRPA